MGNCCCGSPTVDNQSSSSYSAATKSAAVRHGNVVKTPARIPPSAVEVPVAKGNLGNLGNKSPSNPAAVGIGGRTGGASEAMKARASPSSPLHRGSFPDVGVAPVGKIVTPNLKVFTFAELRSATRNFRPDTLLGEGGFGRVFKGWIDPNTLAPSKIGVGIPVAVKKSSGDSAQGLKEWKAEVNFLGKFSHPNLVKLIGYCMEEKELLLVYEYLPKGSLHDHLFNKRVEPPSWSLRMKIAIDAARGLDFLHTSENTVIYRDFKTANILLDADYNAKLSDFGLARQGPPIGSSHVSTQAVGTYGYAAPEYVSTGHLYVTSDVYGFGVVLLEILTGLMVYDLKRPSGQINLVELHKPQLGDRRKLKKIIDPRLGDEYPPEAAVKLAQLILRCLENDPKNRPSMSDVLVVLERISSIMMLPKKTRPAPSQQSNAAARSWDHDPGITRSPIVGRPGNTGPLRSPMRPMR
ncbi:hypothetical protein Dimus_023604 [Dionaea muscipula]